jgi:hypothetical protein
MASPAAKRLARSFFAEPISAGGSAWRPMVTESEATCIAAGLLASLGAERVSELGLGDHP